MVELVTVIAIISLLTALVLPAVTAVRSQVLIGKSKSNLRQLVQANLAHALANGGKLAFATNEQNTKRWCAALVSGRWDRTRGYLSPYLAYEAQIAVCPLLEELLPADGPSFELGTGGYGYNAAYLGGIDGRRRKKASLRLDQIADPSNTIMFATTAYARKDGVQEYPFTEPPFWNPNQALAGGSPSPTTHFRANGQAIIGWADGRISLEAANKHPPGQNPHGGDATAESLGWFGPTENNGHWNPANHWIRGKLR
ncbi:MAG: type II secretion system protein [Puniceicoccaceae bacterium]